MKKIFTTLASVVFFTSMSFGALTVTHDGQPMESGQTITFTEADFVHEDYSPMHRFACEIDLEVKTDAAPMQISITANDRDFMCCPEATGCINLIDNGFGEFSASATAKASSTNMPIDVSYFVESNEIPAKKVQGTVTVTDANNDKFEITVIFDTTNAGSGVEGVADNATVSFSNNVLSYDLNEAAEVEVYSIAGQKVVAEAVSGNGIIDLNNLAKGVYVYRVAGKNGKILVK